MKKRIRSIPVRVIDKTNKEEFVLNDDGAYWSRNQFSSALYAIEDIQKDPKFIIPKGTDMVLNVKEIDAQEVENFVKTTEFMVAELENRLSKRGWTTGKKQWEQRLLFLGYEALHVPMQDRKCGLHKVTKLSDICHRW
jgi:hypothetical protein